MANLLIGIVAFFIVVFAVSSVFGLGLFALPVLLIAATVVLAIDYFKLFKLFPYAAKTKKYALIGIVILGLFTGGFAVIHPMLSFEGITASVTGGLAVGEAVAVPTVTATAPSECKAVSQGGVIPDELWGLASSIKLNAWDAESNTPFSAAVDVNPTFMVKNGQIATLTDTTANSVTDYSVGDVVSFYGGSATYYLTPSENICIDKQNFPIDLTAHQVLATTNLQITGYDDTGGTALSAGTNTSHEDYDITLGADATDTFFVKLKNNVANRAFNFGGWIYRLTNDANKLEMKETGFTETDAPDWTNIQVSADDDGDTNNVTNGYDNAFVASTPTMLHEWDSFKHEFTITAGSTDPTTNTAFGSSSMVIMCAVDAQYSRGDDGIIYNDIYQHNSAESNVGLVELISEPVDKQDCVVVELI